MAFLRTPTRDTSTASLQERIAELRDELFAIADAARASVPFDRASLHVSLQAASNELGNAERALRED